MEEYKSLSRENVSPLVPGVIPPKESESVSFSMIRQTNTVNELARLRPEEGKNLTIDKVTGTATIKTDTFTVNIAQYKDLVGLTTPVRQTLDLLVIKFTESGSHNPTVFLSLDEFMEKRGLKNRQKARAQMADALDVILKTSMTWNEILGKKTVPYAGVNLADSWVWSNGKKTGAYFTFGATYSVYLGGLPVMSYPLELLKINSKRLPNGFPLSRKIAELKNMNAGKSNEDIISVKTLLNNAPYIPSYDEVMKTDRAVNRRIIDPMERDLNALEAFSWEYCHSNGAPLTEEEIKKYREEGFPYELFENLLIKVTWKEYPDQSERIQRAEERKAERRKKPAGKSKTAKKKE